MYAYEILGAKHRTVREEIAISVGRPTQIFRASLKIHQRGVQWTQGVVIYIML